MHSSKYGEVVLWKSVSAEENLYLPWKNISGNQIGRRWLSDDGTRLLTSSGSTIKDTDGSLYQMSEEGIPFVILKEFVLPSISSKSVFRPFLYDRSNPSQTRQRKRRQTNVGIELSDDAASRYSALSFVQVLNHQRPMRHSMKEACLINQFATEQLKAQMVVNPIMALRAYTRNAYTTAVCGGEHCKIYPCEAVPTNRLQWLPMPPNRCYANLPVSIVFNGKNETLFMDPVTNILGHSAIEVKCQISTTIPFSSDGILLNYHKDTGAVTQVSNSQELQFVRYEDDIINSSVILGAVMFTDAAMYSMKDVIGTDHHNDVLHFMQDKQQVWSDVEQMAKGEGGSESAQNVMSYITNAADGLDVWRLLGFRDAVNKISKFGGVAYAVYLVGKLIFFYLGGQQIINTGANAWTRFRAR